MHPCGYKEAPPLPSSFLFLPSYSLIFIFGSILVSTFFQCAFCWKYLWWSIQQAVWLPYLQVVLLSLVLLLWPPLYFSFYFFLPLFSYWYWRFVLFFLLFIANTISVKIITNKRRRNWTTQRGRKSMRFGDLQSNASFGCLVIISQLSFIRDNWQCQDY